MEVRLEALVSDGLVVVVVLVVLVVVVVVSIVLTVAILYPIISL